MSNLKFDGYYLSEAQPYEDWHGGVEIKYIDFIAYWFKQDGRIYIAGKTNENFFEKKDFLIDKKPVYYVEDENSIEVIRNKDSRFEVKSILSKGSADEFSNSRQIKFKFIPWEENKKAGKDLPSEEIDS